MQALVDDLADRFLGVFQTAWGLATFPYPDQVAWAAKVTRLI